MTIRVHSPYADVAHARTLASAWALVRASGYGHRPMLAMARRPDLTENYVRKMLKSSPHGSSLWCSAALTNPAVRHGKALAGYRRSLDALPAMSSMREEFEAEVIAGILLWDGRGDQRFVDLALERVGQDAVTAAIPAVLAAKDEEATYNAIHSRFFTSEHVPAAMDAITALPDGRRDRLAGALASRPDTSAADMIRLLDIAAPVGLGRFRVYAVMRFLDDVGRRRMIPTAVVRKVPRKWWRQIVQGQHVPNTALSFALAGHVPAIADFRQISPEVCASLERVVMTERLSRYPFDEVRKACEALLARDPSLPFVEFALNWYAATWCPDRTPGAQDSTRQVACDWLAAHTSLDPSRHVNALAPVEAWERTLGWLAEHDWPQARALAAARVHPDDADDAFTDPSPVVRAAVVTIEDLPRSVMDAAERDCSPLVRAALASRPDLPPGGLALLAQDACEEVALAAVANPHADGEVIRVAAEGPHPRAAEMATQRFMGILESAADEVGI